MSEETGVLVSVEGILCIESVELDENLGELRILVKCHPLAGAPRPGICEITAGYISMDQLPDLRDQQAEWVGAGLNGGGSILD